MKTNIQLLVIDPQNDFMDQPGAALSVPGAMKDVERLAKMIARVGNKLSDVHVTLDSHHPIHVAHGIMWVDQNGNPPPPFTQITANDVRKGVWRARYPKWQDWQLSYVETLEANGRYVLIIWPQHCLIGSWGHNVQENLHKALTQWENDRFGMVNYVTKGSNYRTEHYSAVQADVPDPNDPTTLLNTALIDVLRDADEVGLTGEALSHCVANTGMDIVNNFGDENIKKLTLLEDATSAIPGFETQTENFLKEMKKRGMKFSTTDKWLA